jgi:hypothetical protein
MEILRNPVAGWFIGEKDFLPEVSGRITLPPFPISGIDFALLS